MSSSDHIRGVAGLAVFLVACAGPAAPAPEASDATETEGAEARPSPGRAAPAPEGSARGAMFVTGGAGIAIGPEVRVRQPDLPRALKEVAIASAEVSAVTRPASSPRRPRRPRSDPCAT